MAHAADLPLRGDAGSRGRRLPMARNRSLGAFAERRRALCGRRSATGQPASGSRSSIMTASAKPIASRCSRKGDGVHTLVVPGLKPGARYGLRADGNYDPGKGDWFDPDKLLVDPYAVGYRPALRLRCQAGGAPRRGWRYRSADAEGDRHPAAAGLAAEAAAVFAGRADLRSAGPRADHAPPRHSRGAARHDRRARASGDHRASAASSASPPSS